MAASGSSRHTELDSYARPDLDGRPQHEQHTVTRPDLIFLVKAASQHYGKDLNSSGCQESR